MALEKSPSAKWSAGKIWLTIKRIWETPKSSIETFFSHHFSSFISRFAIPVIIVSLAITGGLGSGLRIDRQLTDTYELYTSSDSYARVERAAIQNKLWGFEGTKLDPDAEDYKTTASVIVTSKDASNPNIFNKKQLGEIVAFNRYLMDNLSVSVNDTLLNTNAVYNDDLCLTWLHGRCKFNNAHLQSVLDHLNGKSKNGSEVEYPKLFFDDRKYFIYAGTVLGDAIADERKLESFEAILLRFTFKQEFRGTVQKEWEAAFRDYVNDYSKRNEFGLKTVYFDSGAVRFGLDEAGRLVRSRFFVAFGLILAFSVLSQVRFRKSSSACGYALDWQKSFPGMAIIGVATAGMGILSAYGILLYAGSYKATVLTVVPFLVVSIGVDDMFIMVSAFRDSEGTPAERLASTMGHSLVSVTITSLTNAVSFAVGAASTMEVVSIFCKFTSLSIIMNYVYQITFFASCLYLSGKFCGPCGKSGLSEKRAKNKVAAKNDEQTNYKAIEIRRSSDAKMEFADAAPNERGAVNDKEAAISEEKMGDLRGNHHRSNPLAKLTRKKSMRNILILVSVLLLYVIYLIVAVSGCTKLASGFNPERIWPSDSYGTAFMQMFRKYYQKDGMQMDVVVSDAPYLWFGSNKDDVLSMIKDFEDTPYTQGGELSTNWLHIYLFNLTKHSRVEAPTSPWVWTEELYLWMNQKYIVDQFANDILWRPVAGTSETSKCGDCSHIPEAFKFRVRLRNFGSPENRTNALAVFRRIANKYHSLDVTTYQYQWPYIEQDAQIFSVTLRNVQLAILCVLIISIVLIPNLACITGLVVAVISIDVGIFGFMSHWGVTLDAISMMTVLMSIGLSVDYNAHVAYAFMNEPGTGVDRAISALKRVGIPVAQGAWSTILGVLSLAVIDSYMGSVFFKTVFLVIVISVLHACVFYPALLVLLHSYQVVLPLVARPKKGSVKN